MPDSSVHALRTVSAVRQGVRLGTRLPTAGMSPAVDHSGDDDLVPQDAKVNAVRESSDDGAACFAVNSRKGQRIGRNAFDHIVDRGGELNAEPGRCSSYH